MLELIRIFISSFLIFFSTMLLIEAAIFIFKIQNPRLRAISRSIPIFKLPLDLIVYKFIGWDGFWHFYLFGCQGFFKHLLIYLFPVYFPWDSELNVFPTIAYAIMMQIPSLWLISFFVIAAVASVGLVTRKLVCVCQSYLAIKRLHKNSEVGLRPIFNLKLLTELKKQSIEILFSAEIERPFSSGKGMIFIPTHLVNGFTQAEFETIIAHEIEHYRWKDAWVRISAEIIQSFFWWLPISNLLRKIELEQECASDAAIEKYRMKSEDLVTAIYKVIQQFDQTPRNVESRFLRCYFVSNSILLRRLQIIIDEKRRKNSFLATCGLVVMSGVIVGMGFLIC